MSTPKKPFKIPTTADETRRTNVLLEGLSKDIATVAEGVTDIQPRIVRLEKTVGSLVEDMKVVKPLVETLAKDMAELKKDVTQLKTDVGELKPDVADLKTDVKEIKGRLSAAEAKFPA